MFSTEHSRPLTVATPYRGPYRERKSKMTPSATRNADRFEITANAFLRHMVRTLVGTMIVTARGDTGNAPERFPALLTGALRSQAGWTAPAHALCLVRVEYGAF